MLLVKAIDTYRQYLKNMDRSQETIKSYSIELNMFYRHLTARYNGPIYLAEIRLEDVEGYLQILKGKNYCASSRNHSIYILRSFFNFCFKKEYISRNICINLERIPVSKKERIFLTADETKILISKVRSPIAHLILNVLFYTGMRISECINLKISDVDLQNNIISLKNTKNKKDRQIPIHEDLECLLNGYILNWRVRKDSPYLFTTSRTDRVSPDYINKVLHEATLSLGWPKKITCHTLRHSFASNLVAKNVNIVNIQKLLGHSDLSTTSIYTHTNMHELKNAISTI